MKIDRAKSQRWNKIWGRPLTAQAQRAPLGEEFIEGYQPHPGRRMTEEEFVAWVGEKTRAEWVNGEVILMSPVNREHDKIQGWLYRLISEFVTAQKAGEIGGSEFPVRLPNGKQRRLTDLFFVAKGRESGFEKTCFNGAPDLILEVVSPDSPARDYQEKFGLYEAGGVREYWIINPLALTCSAFELVKQTYRPIEEKNGIIRSKCLKGFFLKPAWLWYEPFPRLATALREMGVK